MLILKKDKHITQEIKKGEHITQEIKKGEHIGSPLLCLLGFGLLFVGCVRPTPTTSKTPSHINDRAVARSIVLCKTTEADLRRQLGEPTRDGILHNAHIMSWITNDESPVRYLAVLLDDQGVVVDLYWDIPTEIPWVPTNQCLKP